MHLSLDVALGQKSIDQAEVDVAGDLEIQLRLFEVGRSSQGNVGIPSDQSGRAHRQEIIPKGETQRAGQVDAVVSDLELQRRE